MQQPPVHSFVEEAEQLRGMLGVRQVSYVQGQGWLAVVESPLV